MTKSEVKNLAEEAIVLLQKMFGEGLVFECQEYYKTNEALTGITLKLSSYFPIPMVCLDDLPDGTTAEEVASITAAAFQDLIRNLSPLPAFPQMTRESVLKNVVLQALSRKRNRQMLKVHPHISFLDLAGIFRVPVGPYRKNSLNTALITNQIIDDLGLTVDELAEAARRNTLAKFGTQFGAAHEIALCALTGRSCWSLDEATMSEPGLYTLTNEIQINGAALMLIPEILEKIGEKAGMDYYILPSSIHEVLISKDDGLLMAKELKEIVYKNNRMEVVVKQEDVLSDNVYFYSRKRKELKIV